LTILKILAKSRLTILAAILVLTAPLQIYADRLLASYSFDENLTEVGPDTYEIFQHDYGRVSISNAYSVSGARSLKIQDVEGDGGFPEIQGFFEAIEQGNLNFHFALLLADVQQKFNIALAGKNHFQLVKHGIGFWLDNKDGYLRQIVDKQPSRLFELTPFVWYQVDISYHISSGTYDLVVRDEYNNELVQLLEQKNAVNEPGSTVNKFSFIGDLPDKENASYYVDDIMLRTDQNGAETKWVAPGRKKLFIDIWDDYHRQLYGMIQCVPGVEAIDFAIDDDVFRDLLSQGLLDQVNDLLEGKPVEPGDWMNNPYLQAIHSWQSGCQELLEKNWTAAIEHFQHSRELVPNARIYPLSLFLAYAGAGDYTQLDLMLGIEADWYNDARLSVAKAMIGISRNKPENASLWLAAQAFDAYPTKNEYQEFLGPLHSGQIDRDSVACLKTYEPENWPHYLEQAIITEQYYFALLWEKRYSEAFNYALGVLHKLQNININSSKWNERAADAAFYDQRYDSAITYYRAAMELDNTAYANPLKLADVYHLLGDSALERQFREQVYGRLEVSSE
jgi:hypothetical protein